MIAVSLELLRTRMFSPRGYNVDFPGLVFSLLHKASESQKSEAEVESPVDIGMYRRGDKG